MNYSKEFWSVTRDKKEKLGKLYLVGDFDLLDHHTKVKLKLTYYFCPYRSVDGDDNNDDGNYFMFVTIERDCAESLTFHKYISLPALMCL